MSASFANCLKIATPSGSLRLSVTLFLLRCKFWKSKPWRLPPIPSPVRPPGISILMASAPQSTSWRTQVGPARARVRSRTLYRESGRELVVMGRYPRTSGVAAPVGPCREGVSERGGGGLAAALEQAQRAAVGIDDGHRAVSGRERCHAIVAGGGADSDVDRHVVAEDHRRLRERQQRVDDAAPPRLELRLQVSPPCLEDPAEPGGARRRVGDGRRKLSNGGIDGR